MRRQGAQVGMDRADRWIGLTDGGNGLEPFVQRSFPRVEVVILDFWHVSDRLGDLARTMHSQDEDKAKEQKRQWCHVLKHEGGAAVIALLESMTIPQRGVLRAKYEEVLGYLRNNVTRMDYPQYQAKGWLIGSGAVESACKTVVAQRLKLAGMRWRELGTDAVAICEPSTKARPRSGRGTGDENRRSEQTLYQLKSRSHQLESCLPVCPSGNLINRLVRYNRVGDVGQRIGEGQFVVVYIGLTALKL